MIGPTFMRNPDHHAAKNVKFLALQHNPWITISPRVLCYFVDMHVLNDRIQQAFLLRRFNKMPRPRVYYMFNIPGFRLWQTRASTREFSFVTL